MHYNLNITQECWTNYVKADFIYSRIARLININIYNLVNIRKNISHYTLSKTILVTPDDTQGSYLGLLLLTKFIY